MSEGTNSKAMGADRPYGEFYGFYSISTEYFGYSLIQVQAYSSLELEGGELSGRLLCFLVRSLFDILTTLSIVIITNSGNSRDENAARMERRNVDMRSTAGCKGANEQVMTV
jgi:hypothetical protein